MYYVKYIFVVELTAKLSYKKYFIFTTLEYIIVFSLYENMFL